MTDTTSPPKRRKAYIIHDGDERSVVAFHKHRISAHREGARMLDMDSTEFLHYSTCRRSPEWDRYADTEEIPISEMVANGWWFECDHCGTRLDADLLYDEGKDPNHITGMFVRGSGYAYCNQDCKDKEAYRIHVQKQTEATFIAEMKAKLEKDLGKYDLVYTDKHHWYGHFDETSEASVYFEFPGMDIGPAEFRFRDNREEGEKYTLHCYNGDVAALNKWRGKTHEIHR